MAKLVCLGLGYELWATNTAKAAIEYVGNILTVMVEIKAPKMIVELHLFELVLANR